MNWLPAYTVCAVHRPRFKNGKMSVMVVPDVQGAQRLWADANMHTFSNVFHAVGPAFISGIHVSSRCLFMGPVEISVAPTGQLVKSPVPMVHDLLVGKKHIQVVTGIPPGTAQTSLPHSIKATTGEALHFDCGNPYLPRHPLALCRSCYQNIPLKCKGRCAPCIMKDHPCF